VWKLEELGSVTELMRLLKAKRTVTVPQLATGD